MAYRIRITDDAETDLLNIYRYISAKASPARARAYTTRIRTFLAGFDTFPERGTVRSDVREGLRVVGFERRVNVAFVVEGSDVVILRLLYAGQQFEGDDE